jgi:hypothetical protein
MGLTKFVREVVSAPHYRQSPIETLRYARAKWVFQRFRRTTPSAFLEGIGIDPCVALCGLDGWLPLLERVVRAGDAEDGQGGISLKDGMILYGLARALQPEYVIETGVASGVSTSFFGAALIENGRGSLFSIELPPIRGARERQADGSVYVWQDKGVGWAIPQEIKRTLGTRHQLILQDVRLALPELLQKLSQVDIFFHDDLHTPDHMLWEYRLVWPRVRPGGALASDDANDGWIKFCDSLGRDGSAFNNVDRLCTLRKLGSGEGSFQTGRGAAR